MNVIHYIQQAMDAVGARAGRGTAQHTPQTVWLSQRTREQGHASIWLPPSLSRHLHLADEDLYDESGFLKKYI